MNIMEAMETRRSTRSFSGEAMTAAEAGELSGMLAATEGETAPFGHKVRLALAGGGMGGDAARPVKLGTYGLVSGASAFIVPAVVPGAGAMEDSGYMVEKAVLEATAMGWDSCWIGGIFDRGKAAGIVGLAEGELVPAVIALGKASARRSIADRIVTGAAKSRSRKPMESLVFAVDGRPLADPWTGPASAMRGAPSASNKQPWRLVRLPGGDEWLMFLDEDRIYNNSLGEAHLQNLDTGIGMRHFREAARSAGLEGRWSPLPEPDDRLGRALRFGREKGWIPIALWRR